MHRNAIGIHNLVIGIRKQLEGQAFLAAEAPVAVRRIERDAKHNRVQRLEYLSRSRWKLCASMVQPCVLSFG